MSGLQKFFAVIFIIILLIALFLVVIKPVIMVKYITLAKKYAKGQYTCTLDKDGKHVGNLYRIKNGEKHLVKTTVSNSCIFSKPKINAGFFVFAIGGGGGATPYESGKPGQVVSKYKYINSPVITIKIGKGGHGTYVAQDGTFIDAQDGYSTVIKDINIIALGGSKSTRMTPTGHKPVLADYHIPDRYHYLYDIPKSTKKGAGGQVNIHSSDSSAKSQSGHSGMVVIQW